MHRRRSIYSTAADSSASFYDGGQFISECYQKFSTRNHYATHTGEIYIKFHRLWHKNLPHPTIIPRHLDFQINHNDFLLCQFRMIVFVGGSYFGLRINLNPQCVCEFCCFKFCALKPNMILSALLPPCT